MRACIFSSCLWDSSCSVLKSVSIAVCVCVYTVHGRIGGARLEGCISCRLTGEGAVWIYLASDWQVDSQEGDCWPEGDRNWQGE